ncbi:sensor histidine kinase [Halosolutus gelatinilyticus]|uniref:sensor histidine kinase n=1 Tax=Halosolutus gelatinilyticus TaxID=2931975 RepID=UPI001FF2AB58|nr:PAS domain S-box protein [Halosolutus gelatinilyticus]
MGSPGPEQAVTLEDIRVFFAQLDQPSTSVSTGEVAETLGRPRRAVRDRLQELVERGELQTRQMDDSVEIWWDPEGRHTDDTQRGGAQFSAFVSAVQDYAIFRLDPDGTIASWNDGAERIKGYAEEEIVGEHFSTFYTEEDRAEDVPERNLKKAAVEGTVKDDGWRVQEDGSRFWANVTITAIRDDNGELQGFTKVTRDMTERREYERQLETQAERLERQRDELEEELDDIFERVNDAFYALDEEFRFEYVNDRMEEYYGKPAGEFLGQTVWEVLGVDEDDPLFEKYETAMASQEPTTFERYSELLDLWAIVRVYPSESGLSVYFRDITDRKTYERKLKESNERLEEFAYAASHDLQEPLRMVSSYLQLIEDQYADDLDEDGVDFIEFAVDGADRMRDMIDGLLEYSRVEAEGDPFQPVDLNAILRDVLADLRFRIEEHNAEMSVENLPTVHGDVSQLRQLFQNLLTNAIDYSGEDPPRVHVSAERDGAMWQVSVSDEGIGIDPDDQERIFEVFQRLHTREEHDGTGIGLALCKRIVERHGGEITVESEPDAGATLSMTLPAADDPNQL